MSIIIAGVFADHVLIATDTLMTPGASQNVLR
jgi:hypothetical protein